MRASSVLWLPVIGHLLQELVMRLATEYEVQENDFKAYSKSLQTYVLFLNSLRGGGSRLKVTLKWLFVYIGAGVVCGLFAVAIIYAAKSIWGVKLGSEIWLGFALGLWIGYTAFCLLSGSNTRKLQTSVFSHLIGTQAELVFDETRWSFKGMGTAVESKWRDVPLRALEWQEYLIVVTPVAAISVPQRALDRPVSEIVQFMQACQEAAALDIA